MSSTNPTPTATATRTTRIRVLYNDALANRQSDTEEALTDSSGRPYRHSERRTDTRVAALISERAGMFAASRILSDQPYQAGDPLLEVLTEDVDTPDHPSQTWAHAQCERVYAMLNIRHPEGWAHRSMSIGDVIVVGETAWVCDAVGFTPADGITDDQIKTAAR